MVWKKKQKYKYFRISGWSVVDRYTYKPSKTIRTLRKCSECQFLVKVEPVKINEPDGDRTLEEYEDIMAMERFNDWMMEEHPIEY